VAIAWGGYFNSLISPWVQLPGWLTHGYWNAHALAANGDAAIRTVIDTAPRFAGIPVLVNLPAFLIVMAITWLLVIGVRESTRVNNAMVVVKLIVLTIFVVVGALHIDPANYHPFAPNGFRGIHQGAAIVFFAFIGFDAISTAAEETKNPQRNMPRGIMLGLGICTVIYMIVGAVATGLIPYTQLKSSDPLAHAFDVAGLTTFSWIISLGAVVSMAAVLLVFQYGQPRIFYAMARDGLLPPWAAKIHPKYRTPHITTILTGVLVALGALVADDAATYDLTNIGTLSAFALVCLGVLVLRIREPDRPRPFRVPFVWGVTLLGAAACIFVMFGLPIHAWERFAIWLAIGLVLYFAYGYKHSTLRGGAAPVPLEPPPPGGI
jgi:APA family basic amino acid/polyamine antiporter